MGTKLRLCPLTMSHYIDLATLYNCEVTREKKFKRITKIDT